jgi:hypothetical protein
MSGISTAPPRQDGEILVGSMAPSDSCNTENNAAIAKSETTRQNAARWEVPARRGLRAPHPRHLEMSPPNTSQSQLENAHQRTRLRIEK